MAAAFRPRRSVLYMPGSNPRALEKARTLEADALILDLEDAVAPDAKAVAREQVAAALKQGGFGPRETIIRVNGPDTEWGEADLKAACAAGPDAILVPKVSSAEDIMRADHALKTGGAPAHTALWAMMETPRAMLDALSIAEAAKGTRLVCFVMGTNDLAKETRAQIIPGRAPMDAWLMACVAAARIAGIDIIDGVYNHIADAAGFERECREARERGFDGKTLIHPNQIEPANRLFAPTEQDVAWARTLIAAFEEKDNANKGALQIDGKMVERLHADIGRRTVAIAEAIASRQ
jgi:citrate lyase subunit beta / citryl-CoA lyase